LPSWALSKWSVQIRSPSRVRLKIRKCHVRPARTPVASFAAFTSTAHDRVNCHTSSNGSGFEGGGGLSTAKALVQKTRPPTTAGTIHFTSNTCRGSLTLRGELVAQPDVLLAVIDGRFIGSLGRHVARFDPFVAYSLISKGWFGAAPNTSGAYIASTRVDGSVNLPG
jgi:hypothetical protein